MAEILGFYSACSQSTNRDLFFIPKAEIGISFLFPFPACVFKGIQDIQDALNIS